MNMKLVIAVFVVLVINQIQAQFPIVADKDGIQIDFVRRVDGTATRQELLNYAKFLAKQNSHPQQIRPPPSPPIGEMANHLDSYLSLMRPPIKPPTKMTHPPIKPPTGMADHINSYLSLMRPPIRPPTRNNEMARPPVSPPGDNEMAEDQTTALCPTLNCTCNVSLLIAHGFIRDRNSRPTDNCTVYNVPYCEGVCSSSYRYKPVRADTQPVVLERHQCCHATTTDYLTFFTLCIPYSGGNAYAMAYAMLVPTGCECSTCPSP